MEQTKRNTTLDIAKGICIILMVIGHSGCPVWMERFIYMFHMPCFFFISGYLLSDKYLADLKSGLLKRVKGSYWPFIKWELVFLLFHNLFASLHIYAESYSLREYSIKTFRILTMTGGEQLLGGYWFLISLCWASVFSLLFLYIINKGGGKLNNYSIIGGVLLALSIAVAENFISVKIPAQFGAQTFFATAFYLSGFLLKRVRISFNRSFLKGIALLVVPVISSAVMEMSITGSKGLVGLVYYLIAMSGTMGVLFISYGLNGYDFSKHLAYIGSKTLYILTFHFLAFKFTSYVYIKINGLSIDLLTRFPVLDNTSVWMWAIYSVAGLILPLLVDMLIMKLQSLLRKSFGLGKA